MGLKSAIQHIQYHHDAADGWITLAKKKDRDHYEQHHYRIDELDECLSEWIGQDVYFSQNTFYKPVRRIENVRQLRALYVDVDHHLLNYDPEWVTTRMELDLFNQSVPDPNLIIHSGRGYHVVWLLEPTPAQALPLWTAIERYLAEQLRSIGGDTKATDAARILRLAGTTNSRNDEEVFVKYRHSYRYTLREIQSDYLPPLPVIEPKKKGKKSTRTSHIFNIYSLHYARIRDLVRLVQIRNYDVRGYRETICFLYRYWNCCFLEDEVEALRQTQELNAEFREPLSIHEVERATKSAETAWKAKNNVAANRKAQAKGYPGAGYNISNKKLIEWLDITEDEQKRLKSIIGKTEKQKRDTKATREARREAGALPRSTYLAKAEERRSEACKMRMEGMNVSEIARTMKTSRSQVNRMLKRG